MDVMRSQTAAPAGTASAVVPVVPGSFLLGSALDLRRDMLGLCERAFQRYGDAVRFRFGPPGGRMELYLLFHPDAAHRVLAGWPVNYRKENVFYSEIRSAFGDGLLTTQDAEWQRQKRYLQPLFVARRVNGYAAAMTEQVQQVVQRWRARRAGTVDLNEEMNRLTLATVCRVLFGEDLGQALPVVQRTFGPLGDAVQRRAIAGGCVPRGWPTPVNQRLRRAQPGQRRPARGPAGAVARCAGRGKLADRRRGPRPGARLLAGRARNHLDCAHLRAAPARPASRRAAPGAGGGGHDRGRSGHHRPGCPGTRVHHHGAEGGDAALPVGAVPRPAGGPG